MNYVNLYTIFKYVHVYIIYIFCKFQSSFKKYIHIVNEMDVK